MQRLAAALARRGCSEGLQLARQAGAVPAAAAATECCSTSFALPAAAAATQWQQLRFASKKQGGSTQNTKDSNPKYLGVKLFGGQRCIPGNIIMRQRGTEFHPGSGVGMGRDHTIYALIEGRIKFSRHPRTKRRFISVEPLEAAAAPAVAALQQQAAGAARLQQQPRAL
ncbi:50S ribosomal L27 [Micractinium conductrix]|uniref:50S ribosomal L27 n=1 Tax=Micractinium conductrix TaxID=554055 RepID=A0A2P6VFB2_9CHLO|nr:50S ribosomal L27 [Micractinium conductrix]|eukprot:PSC72759.1 50S ribosomal L27 [Micractinium conductrix]